MVPDLAGISTTLGEVLVISASLLTLQRLPQLTERTFNSSHAGSPGTRFKTPPSCAVFGI
jgi:hypothetical protein